MASLDTLGDDFKLLSEETLASITFAATAFPVAWPIAEFVYDHQCDPISMISAGLKWLDVYESLRRAGTDAASTVHSVQGDSWSGDDRLAFDAHMLGYGLELVADEVVAVVVGVTMVVVGGLLAILMIACAFVATVLALMAAFFWLCVGLSAIGVGAPAAADVEFAADDFADAAFDTLESSDRLIKTVSETGASLITSALAGNVTDQALTGNLDDLVHNLVQTVVYGTLDTVAGLASKKEQDLTTTSIGHENPYTLLYANESNAKGEAVDDVGDWAVGKDTWENGGSAWLNPAG
jgi:hypothetical protein